MKPLVLCYSLTGNTKKICGCLAKSLRADFAEIKEISHRGKIGAYTLGAFAAIRRKSSDIRPIATDIAAYGTLVIATPVWAGNVTPAVNDFVREYELRGKTVYGLLTHLGGPKDAAKNLKEEIEAAGAVCPNVLSLEATKENIYSLKAGRRVFALENNVLVLRDGEAQ